MLRPHLYSGLLPSRCLVRISDGVFVSSPEFCFLQAAAKLPLVKVIELGFELCGTYAKTEYAAVSSDNALVEMDPYHREQLTSVRKLSAFIERIEGVAGKIHAFQALRYIVDGSASPRETALVMLLVLPYKLGGYGLPMPELNFPINPNKLGKQYTGKSSFSCDLYWPKAREAVEYNSDEFHSKVKEKADDSLRRNVLTTMGVKVINVDNEQIKNRIQLEGTANQLASNLGKPLRYRRNPKFSQAQQELRKMLLQPPASDSWK